MSRSQHGIKIPWSICTYRTVGSLSVAAGRAIAQFTVNKLCNWSRNESKEWWTAYVTGSTITIAWNSRSNSSLQIASCICPVDLDLTIIIHLLPSKTCTMRVQKFPDWHICGFEKSLANIGCTQLFRKLNNTVSVTMSLLRGLHSAVNWNNRIISMSRNVLVFNVLMFCYIIVDL